MSTDHQRYSIGSQIRAIQAYADRNQLKVVRIYRDEGKSGLTFSEREGLAQLIADIIAGRNDFSNVLVFDISRWGRFQDLDESAHYEFLCRRNGVRVTYCEDAYVNDGNPYSAVIKVLKRAQAADDSRIKSARVFATLCELANSGLHTGGPAPYGFVRVAVDESRQRMQRLTPGTQRAIRADKIILMKGNKAQLRVIRHIFDLYVSGKVSAHGIASRLNANGIVSPRGGRWCTGTIISMLSNQVYTGIKCWNRSTSRLKTKRRKNDRSSWILYRISNKGVIDAKQFERAQQIKATRGRNARKSDEQLLAEFKELMEKYGPLPTKWFGLAPGLSSPTIYKERFGSIRRVFELTGAKCSKRRLIWQNMLSARQTTTRLLDEIKLEAEKCGDSIEVTDGMHIVHTFRFNKQLTGQMVLLERKEGF
ncbi:MAG: recombinase family protein [Rhodospirillales bacterium]|nr:recombinase family protein [Rhodospirillales bacterium]